jgi:hypothetical protein
MVSNQVPSTNLVEMDSLDLLNALVIDNHPPQQHFEIFETRVVDLDSIIGYNRPDSPVAEFFFRQQKFIIPAAS